MEKYIKHVLFTDEEEYQVMSEFIDYYESQMNVTVKATFVNLMRQLVHDLHKKQNWQVIKSRLLAHVNEAGHNPLQFIPPIDLSNVDHMVYLDNYNHFLRSQNNIYFDKKLKKKTWLSNIEFTKKLRKES